MQDQAQTIGIAVFVVCIMMSVGLDLRLSQIVAALKHPGRLAAAMGFNHIVMPAIAFGWAALFQQPEAVVVGVLLAAACPGGPMGSLLSQLAHGDLGFSVALVFLMTLASTVTVPLLLPVFLQGTEGAGEVDLGPSILRQIVLFQLIPLSVAMTVRHLRPALAARALPVFKGIAGTVMAAIAISMLVMRGGMLFELGAGLVATHALTVVSAIGLGFVVGIGGSAQRVTVSLNSGIRNIAIAILVADRLFDEATTLIVMTYALMMFITTSCVALAYRSFRVAPPRTAAQEESAHA